MNATAEGQADSGQQYSLVKILIIWALAAIPMGVISWLIFPALSPDAATDPLGSGVTRLSLLTVGLVWLFVLSLIIVRMEEGDLRWSTIKRRLRLNGPIDPKTGKRRNRLWLWVLPFLAAIVVYELFLREYVGAFWVGIFPFFAEPKGYGMDAMFQPQIIASLKGAWWFFFLFLVQAAFNTFLGEEFLFRGVLLPKMEGVFGKWAWVANGALHGAYHLHQPWGIGPSVLSCMLYAFPSQRWRTSWMGIIVHSAQSFYFAFLILGVVLGLA